MSFKPRRPSTDRRAMGTLLRRLALLTVLLAFCVPSAALAIGGGDHRSTARVADDATDLPEADDADAADAADGSRAASSNPFCLVDDDPDGLDEVDVDIQEDPAYVEGDILDEEVGDEPVDLDGILDFCDDGAVGGEPAVGSLKRTLRGLSVPTDTMNISVPGTITRTLRLSKAGLPRALRPYASLNLGSARKVARSDGFLDLPVLVNTKGRKALRKATRDVKLVLESTETLASGQSRTRTQSIVLER